MLKITTQLSFNKIYEGVAWRKNNYLWLIDQIANIKELPTDLGVNFLETVYWDSGVPLFILRHTGNKIIRLAPERLHKRFVQLNFCNEKPAIIDIPQDNEDKIGSLTERLLQKRQKKSNQPDEEKEEEDMDKKGYRAKVTFIKGLDKMGNEIIGKKLINDKGMNEILTKWSSKLLKNIISFQALLKITDKTQIVIRVHYIAPFNVKLKEFAIDYSKSIKKEEGNEEIYKRKNICLNILRKISMVLSCFNRIEILEIKAEFYAADNDYWLSDAWDIVWKYGIKRDDEKKEETACYSINDYKRNQLLKKLQARNEEVEVVIERQEKIDRICEAIGGHVSNIRYSAGINKAMAPAPRDEISNNVFEKLCPQCPFKFSDMLSPGFKPKCTPIQTSRGVLALTAEASRLSRNELVIAILSHKDTSSFPKKSNSIIAERKSNILNELKPIEKTHSRNNNKSKTITRASSLIRLQKYGSIADVPLSNRNKSRKAETTVNK